jgi:hypothetical protein
MTNDPARLTVSLFNYENGGFRDGAGHDFTGLRAAFTDDPDPDLIVVNEAKYWTDRGEYPLLTALAELATLTGRPYVGRVCEGVLAPAVAYDPRVLRLRRGEDRSFVDKHGRMEFDATTGWRRFVVRAEHWPFWSGDRRLDRAVMLARHGTDPTPTLVAGDLNSTASGPHLPAVDWQTVPVGVRDYTGLRAPDGTWGPDTRAVDRLIGAWDTKTAGRVDGAGFHSAAELDPQAPRPLPATTNDGGSGLHIDHILINDAWRAHGGGVVPGSYQVHIPRPGLPAPSDHRRVTVTLLLPTALP